MTPRVTRFLAAFYPVVFPVAYVLNIWASSANDPRGVLRSVAVAIAIGLVVSLIAHAIAGRTRGGLAASGVLGALIAPPESPAVPVLLAMALIALVDGAVRRRAVLAHGPLIDRVMLALASVVSLAVILKIVVGGSLGAVIADLQLDAAPRGPVEASAGSPDIVMVMLDGFPGDAAAALASRAGSPYDADAFPAALTDLGFHVQRNSHSNYVLTPMTLASMFDMRHLADNPALTEDLEPGGTDRVLRRLVDESAALELLHRSGYEIVWVDGGFSSIEVRRVDRWIDHGMPSEFEVALLARTGAGQVLSAVAPNLFSELQRERVLVSLSDVPRLIEEPHSRPRFVFVHIPSPHVPWVFGPAGEPRTETLHSFFLGSASDRGIDRQEALRRVFDQATFVAQRTAAEVADLVTRPNPPVVVVFSDHGPRTDLSTIDPLSSDLVEASSNFLATFTPEQAHLFDSFTTPVNIFPTLFGGYLGYEVARQPDTLYAWSGRVTDLVEVDLTQQPAD